MAGTFPSWQTTLIVDATHWHGGEAKAPRSAVATIHIRARQDGALMVTVSNGELAPEMMLLEPHEAGVLNRVHELLFSHPSQPSRVEEQPDP